MNGYLAENFVSWWAPKGQDKPDQPAELACKAWNQKYSSDSVGQQVDHKALLKSRDKDYLKARKDFEVYLPELLAAYRKPLFVVPSDKMTQDDLTLNFVAVKETVYAVTGYVESKVAEGEPELAVEILAPVFSLAINLQGHSSMVHDMLGVSVRNFGLDCLVKNFSPNSDLRTEHWLKLAESLLYSVPPENLTEIALGNDLVLVDQALETVANASPEDEVIAREGILPAVLPGMMAREIRIYHNNMATLIDQVKATGNFNPESTKNVTLWGFLTGRVSELSAVCIPDFQRANANLTINRRRTVASAVATGLLAYRVQHGKNPESLEKLIDLGLELPPHDFLLYENAGKTATLRFKVPAQDMTALRLENQETGSSWFKWDSEGGVFTF